MSAEHPSKPAQGKPSGPDFQRTDPRLLSRMIGAPEEPDVWRPEDLVAMLRHQLGAALAQDLEAALPGAGARAAELARGAVPAILTFRDLLWHPQPPLGLLELLKDFAKAGAEDAGQSMPRELASVFYFGSIALAAQRGSGGGGAISSLSKERLRAGLLWTLRQPWLDDATRALLISLVPQE